MERAGVADDLVLVTDAARRAGEIAMGFFRRDPKTWWKEGNSPVSEADLAVDRFLKDTLLAARPGYGWLSEETAPDAAAGRDQAPGRTGARFFVVDPIDGTRAYLRGEDTWCVSVAVVEDARPVVGVLDAAARGEVFTAVAGGPARLNGDPIAVRDGAAGGPLHVAMPDALRRRLPPGVERSFSFAPAAPSLAYRLAEVACGRLDGTIIRPHANDWDIAAADLILERAGGAVVDVADGQRLYKIEGRRHGVLIAAAGHALAALGRTASALAAA